MTYRRYFIYIKQFLSTWKGALTFVIFTFLLYTFLKGIFDTSRSEIQSQYSISKGDHVYYFDDMFFINNTATKKILLWNDIFLNKSSEIRIRSYLENCSCLCHVTSNKNEIESADAVVIQLIDLWRWATLPKTRVPHQVWVLFNMETPVFVRFIEINLSFWNFIFNWTMSYRTDSTVYSPYGYYRELSKEENLKNAKVLKSHDMSHMSLEKSKMVYAVVGNCYDDSGRLNLLRELKHHVPLDIYGKCGNLFCLRKNPELCHDNIKMYKFKAAFENGNCRDYVTEKFWNALETGAIPIVNWKREQVIKSVPPRSYINVYDFDNVAQLGSFIKKVSENKTLFDSYHAWRTKFKAHSDMWTGFCNLCVKLHEKKRRAQTIIDPLAWVKDDTCRTWTITNTIRRHLNYWGFKLGWRYDLHGNKI